jgi:hypothetical protein
MDKRNERGATHRDMRYDHRSDWPYLGGTPALPGFPGLLAYGGFPYPLPSAEGDEGSGGEIVGGKSRRRTSGTATAHAPNSASLGRRRP